MKRISKEQVKELFIKYNDRIDQIQKVIDENQSPEANELHRVTIFTYCQVVDDLYNLMY